MFCRFERFGGNALVEQRRLNHACAVAHAQKLQFAFVGLVRDPAVKRYRLARVRGDLFDGYVVCHVNSSELE